jgi:hypothetical protein
MALMASTRVAAQTPFGPFPVTNQGWAQACTPPTTNPLLSCQNTIAMDSLSHRTAEALQGAAFAAAADFTSRVPRPRSTVWVSAPSQGLAPVQAIRTRTQSSGLVIMPAGPDFSTSRLEATRLEGAVRQLLGR